MVCTFTLNLIITIGKSPNNIFIMIIFKKWLQFLQPKLIMA